MAQPAVNDVLTWDGTKGVYAPNPALSLALTDTYIFVGNSIGVATGVALTLNATAGPFALGNTGILTMPDASGSGRGLLNATGWATVGFLHNDGAGNLEFQTIAAITGSGTLNYIPKFTPDGSTLGNSLIFDDGTNVGVGTATPAVTFNVKGTGNSVATNSFRVSNSDNTSILNLANNGRFTLTNTDGTTTLSLDPVGSGGSCEIITTNAAVKFQNVDGEYWFNRSAAGRVLLYSNGRNLSLSATSGGAANLTIDTTTGNVAIENATASTVPYFDASRYLVSSTITPTELGYLTGATSPLQAQIDAIVSGLSWKQAVRVRTTGNITLSGTQTIDGIAVIANDRVLVMDQTDPKENGIYVCSAGAWSRSTDADTGAELLQATVATQEGTLYADQQYVCTTDAPIVIGVSNIVFILVGGTTYVGTTNRITVTGNVIDIASTYLGQTSITTLGTITTGVWNGTTITDSYIATSYIKADGTRALTGDWAAGSFGITAKNMAVTGTGGAGYYDFIAQSSNASAPAATGFRLFSGSTGNLSWAKKDGADTFVRGLVGTFTADRDQTLQDTTDTFVYLATTDTLTNKRITKRVVSTTQSATPAINSDNGDIFTITGLAQAVTSFTTNLTGTPTQGQLISIEITDNGTARALTFGASFAAAGTLALPTTTVASTLLKCLFQYDTTTSKWVICAVV